MRTTQQSSRFRKREREEPPSTTSGPGVVFLLPRGVSASTALSPPNSRYPLGQMTHGSMRALLTAIVYRHLGVVACREICPRLFGWPLPSSLRSDILHLGTSDINKRIRRRGITLHRMRTLRSIEWLKLPVLNPLQVFSQLASVCSVESLVKVGDAAIGNWKSPPQFTLATLTEHISEHLRARPKLEAAVDLIREYVDSPMETDLRLWAISRNLPEPEVHPAVYCPTIDRTLHPDLGFPKKSLRWSTREIITESPNTNGPPTSIESTR